MDERVIILQLPDDMTDSECKHFIEQVRAKKGILEGYHFVVGRKFSAMSKDEFKKLVAEMK